jgi:hypothetical protein
VGIIFLLITNRAFMIFLGEGYWIYGYMMLYILYAASFVYLISKRLYPFQGEVVLREAKVSHLVRVEGLTAEEVKLRSKRCAGSPECHLLVITGLYFALVVVAKYVPIKGGELQPWLLFGLKQFSFEEMAGLSVLLAVTVFCFVCLVRLIVRKAKGMQAQAVNRAIRVRACFVSHQVIFWLLSFACCCWWSVFAWSVTQKAGALVLGICGSLCVLSFAQAFLYFACNEFDYFQDVDKLNRKIDSHNRDIASMEKSKAQLQAKIRSGEVLKPDAEGLPVGTLRDFLPGEGQQLESYTLELAGKLIEKEQKRTEQQLQEELERLGDEVAAKRAEEERLQMIDQLKRERELQRKAQERVRAEKT